VIVDAHGYKYERLVARVPGDLRYVSWRRVYVLSSSSPACGINIA
jgi:hypothetical protein